MIFLVGTISISFLEGRAKLKYMVFAWGVVHLAGPQNNLGQDTGGRCLMARWPQTEQSSPPVSLSFLAHIPLDVVSLHNSRKGKGTLWTLHHSRYILKWKLWRWELWWWWRENVLALGSPPLMSLPLPYNWTVCKNLDYIPLYALLSYALTLCAAFLTSLEASKLTSLLLFFTRGS